MKKYAVITYSRPDFAPTLEIIYKKGTCDTCRQQLRVYKTIVGQGKKTMFTMYWKRY